MNTDKVVFLKGLYVAEAGVASAVKSLLSQSSKRPWIDKVGCADWVQQELGMRLGESQVHALQEALDNPVMVITGGPGTGKTTLIKAVLAVAEKMGQGVLLAAPTGRAAKRMAEATGHEAKTIHRLLEYSPSDNAFQKNGHNRLDADLVVIDEMSMVDISLMYRLLAAIPVHASLLMVGDADQLHSVGPGNVLRDIIDSGVVHTRRLDAVFRQSGQSMIVANAHRVNAGQMPVVSQDGKGDFRFIELEDDKTLLRKVVSLCKEGIPGEYGIDPIRDIQVLCPMHRGLVGTERLNRELQRRLNPGGGEVHVGELTLKPGDKVMQTVNNYDKEVFNGDIGKVQHIDREMQEISIDYSGRTVTYDYGATDDITLAYAVSVHKSQGSEYPVVIMPVSMQHGRLLQRDVLYTAITRARRLVILVGSTRALKMAVANNRARRRYSYLRDRLRW